ncbi:hypothetical protein DPMN_079115 [Dreissena polymorpha]|uniref:Uncharacterized protein n=1 Tax=Dreissena polymorpha TaxID=45954 RepID=A0A9D3YSH9_DREPO|nr:hypothetical protein DPMN_079115 [Dreissena polymorpha]
MTGQRWKIPRDSFSGQPVVHWSTEIRQFGARQNQVEARDSEDVPGRELMVVGPAFRLP